MTALFDGAVWEFSVAFSKGAKDTVVDADYTNLSQWVRGAWSSNRGRSSERDTFQAGSITVALFNEARRFDPQNASGPYFGNLQPMKHCRLRVTYSGGTSYVFKGYVQGWPQGYEAGSADGTVRIVAHDAFKLLAKKALPESVYATEVLADIGGSGAWYRLGEENGTTICLDSSGNGRHGYYEPASTQTRTQTTGLIEFGTDAASQFTTSATSALAQTVISQNNIGGAFNFMVGGAFSWEMWVKFPAVADYGNSTQHNLWTQVNSTNTRKLTIAFGQNFDGTRFIQIDAADNIPTVTSALFNLSASLNDGNRHHLAFTRNAATGVFYIDGVAQTAASGSLTFSTTGTDFGSISSVISYSLGGKSWVYDELAIYGSALSAARVLAHYTAGTTAYSGDTVSARITRTMAAAGMSTFPTSIDTSTQTVRGCDWGGGNTRLLDYLQLLERTEGGQARLFIAADGTLTFHSRYHDAGRAVAVAFTDISGSTIPYTSVSDPEYDDTRIYNDVQVQRTNGVLQRVTDTTSDTAYGSNGLSVTGLASLADAEMLDRANGLLYQYKDPHLRVRSLTFTPALSNPSTMVPIARTTEIGARISVRKLPQMQGSAWTKELTVEGISHQVDLQAGTWQVSYLTASGDTSSVWLILDDTTFGLLDTGRLGY